MPDACELCSAHTVNTRVQPMVLPYGEAGPNRVMLRFDAPITECSTCGESYTAEGYEEAELAAIAKLKDTRVD
ncbi:hypothetical protein BAJUN_01360 [Bajunvirus bajun]|uniref:YgiT-type zinc finger protein n=1 Tax=Brevundimonas phage vB_BgoS-Bajun TaxID=2948594 RepID=A0A9E7STA3_9CAUD|nr:hypothetical protein BAJUN_01360 [Brevundimonas phage vB_BgoS-Bajun]